MNNQSTKNQIRVFLEKAVEEAKNPDLKDLLKKKRLLRSKKVSKRYGL